jgi:DNA-binding transcriptional LysR family regulator
MRTIYAMNIRTFDLNLLRALYALLDSESVSGAARRLNLTQPATSAALGRLRHALGDQLLIRSGNQMILTPRAERLLPRLRVLMTDLEQALGDDEFDPERTERAFRIAAIDDAIEIIVGPTIERLRTAAPHARFDIISISENVELELAEGKIDVAIGADWWLRRVRQRTPLFTDSYIGISGSRRRPSLSAYVNAEHVLVAPHGRKPGVVDDELRRKGLERRVTVTVPDFASAARLVVAGPMIATIPTRIATHYAKHYPLHMFEPPLALPGLEMSLAAHPRALADPAVSWLIAQLKAVT